MLTSSAARGQTIAVSKDNRTVAVNATERVTVLADAATVHVGYLIYGKDRDTAYNSATALSSAIVKALTSSGIPLDAIESDAQGLEPVQNFQVDRLTPAEASNRKFQVQQSWLVHTSATDAAKALDVAVRAGADQSGQIEWSLKDENAATAGATARAVEQARAIASQMVSPSGGKVGALLFASNETESSPIRPIAMAAMLKSGRESQPLTLAPRRLERSVTVHAVFSIE